MAVGDPEVSSDGLLSALLSAPEGGIRAIARLLESAAFSVVVFERSDTVRIAYVNAAAARNAVVGRELAVGMAVDDVFPQVDAKFIGRLMEQAASQSGVVNLKGLLPGGAAWSIDAVAVGSNRLLVMAEELGGAASSRQRLEALIASLDAIWRATDFNSTAASIVEQAGRLFPGVDIGFFEVTPEPPHRLDVVAANADWMSSAAGAVEDDSVIIRAATRATTVELSLPSDAVLVSRRAQPADVNAVRALPLPAFEPVASHATPLGVLLFAKKGGAPFTAAETDLMDEFGKLVGLAAHRAALLAAARDSAERSQLTLDLAMAFASSQSPREVIQLLLRRALEVVHGARATLSRIDGDELTIEATYSREADVTWVGRRYGLDWLDRQPLLRRAFDGARPVIGGPLDAEQAAPEFQQALRGVRQTAIVPLILGGAPSGLLVVSRTIDTPFAASDVAILELMGNAAMLALRNARLLEDLTTANLAKSDFLNMAAHELRTPVTVIKGYTSMLRSEPSDDVRRRNNSLDVIERKAAELGRLVESLLTAARAQSGAITEVSPVDATDALRQAVARALPFAELRGGAIGLSLPSAPVHVLGSDESIGRILDNLLNNAVAYSEGAPRIEARLSLEPGHADLEIEDRGQGMAPEHHEAIFDAFVRVDSATPSSIGGAGLGLYISKQLAQGMGAELSLVRSEPGQGSVFRLRLRLASTEEAA